LAGFGRAVSEVGSVLIVGGNITSADGISKTRTLTTAIQLEARQGQYETAMILGASSSRARVDRQRRGHSLRRRG